MALETALQNLFLIRFKRDHNYLLMTAVNQISTNDKFNIVFWHNVLSEHQSAMVMALADQPGVTVYFGYEDSEQRGWFSPNFGKAEILDARQPEVYDRLLSMTGPQDIHVLSGYFSYPVAWQAFHTLRKTQARLFILSEAFDFRGIRGCLRLLRSRLQTMVWGNAIDAVLAMGTLGTSFYRSASFPLSKLYEFAYFVDSPPALSNLSSEEKEKELFKILFVGKLIRRKGLDLLFKALAQSDISLEKIQLDIIGIGSEQSNLEAMAQELGLVQRIKFWGGQPNDLIPSHMQQADLFVLPSRWDGWGAVISESLMNGTPVLCSDMCGASTLVKASDCGGTFKSQDISALSRELKVQVEKGKLSLDQRQHLRQWATCLSPSSAADYLLTIIKTFDCNQSAGTLNPPWQYCCND